MRTAFIAASSATTPDWRASNLRENPNPDPVWPSGPLSAIDSTHAAYFDSRAAPDRPAEFQYRTSPTDSTREADRTRFILGSNESVFRSSPTANSAFSMSPTDSHAGS